METMDRCRDLLMKSVTHLEESNHEVNNVDTIKALSNSLIWVVICFIIHVFQKELRKQGKLQKEIGERKAQFRNGWKKASLYPDWRKEFYQAVNVILDPDTAHPALILSEGNKRVTLGKESQDLPKNPQRFHSLPCVLGHHVISSRRCYWEVEVEHSEAWDLGICRNNVTREGKISIKPQNGFWAIRFYKDEYWALTSLETKLFQKERLTRVCIFLECEDGLISFYNMIDKSHIHTFSQCSFEGPLRPFFRLFSSDPGHLTICPVP
ncbi:butyrophilin subfamily 2 member A2-like isoform X3 [Phyllostomus hastatus]|uniref:butyrophilin subfamily 2 member A2-like isoform X3 n=1 Tax=Phyllostomus hastatus TaxID=9423 RepID=UPI001E68131E|nr:butyrophilin subfamily 2 member A2-like isoform X3 [Phyllostomus hastatus]